MDGMRVVINVHLHGTLAANAQGVVPLWKSKGGTLIEVAATAGNDSAATLEIGVGGANPDANGIMTAKAIGDSGSPVYFTVKDFDGVLADPLKATCPRFAGGDAVTWFLDFDGDAGTAAENVDIAFTFLEGGVKSEVTGLKPSAL